MSPVHQHVRTMQIITFALIQGALMFGAIAFFIVGWPPQPQPQGQLPIISYLAWGMAVVEFLLSLIVPGLSLKSKLKALTSKDDVSLVQAYSTKLIIQQALLEGAVFFNLVAYLIEHLWPSLVVAGALLTIMLVNTPTRTRVEEWIENIKLELETDQPVA